MRPRHILPLLVLSLAACDRTSGLSERVVGPDPVLSTAAFDRFETLCLAHIDQPLQAVAFAGQGTRKIGSGDLTERASVGDNAVFDCAVSYKPGHLSEALSRAMSRSQLWGRKTNGLDGARCSEKPAGYRCLGNALDRPINAFDLTFNPGDGTVTLHLTAWMRTTGI